MNVNEETVRRYAALNVPRYTSYPTAAEFSAAVTADDHARWLARVPVDQRISLYLHVPYCRELCHYCGCHTKIARRDDVIDDYRRALEAEIETVARHLAGRMQVARLHWGGGTPSILGASGMASVLDALGRHFQMDGALEHAIELDPRHVGQTFAESLKGMGVNRASLGVQDTNPQVQAAIGRIQPIETVRAATADLRAAGIASLNFDLIYGLPLQTISSIRETCAAVAALSPDRIACYGYAHMPERRANQRLIDGGKLPTSAERIEQSSAVAAEFMRHGYEAVGIDHFAKPDDSLAFAARAGRLRRNFQGYTDDDCPTLIGFGASAISRVADGYIQNVSDNPSYCRTAEEGRLASVRGCAMGRNERARARIIESLMCNFRVDLNAVASGHRYERELEALRPMISEGLLAHDEGVLTVAPWGRSVVRVVAAQFDQNRSSTHGAFSQAI